MVETGASTQDSTSVVPSLPKEIIMAILLKLPVKSLLRFKSVEKPWLALISSPEFVKMQLHSSANDKEYNNHRVIMRWDSHLRECSLSSLLLNPITEQSVMDYPMRNSDIMWCDTVNGLICFAGMEKTDKLNPKEEVSICSWNPSIRRDKILPRITLRSSCYTSLLRYGFGYDELNDEYKIVVILNVFNDVKVKIYSLKTDYSWRTFGDFQEDSLIDYSAKCVKGKLYWTTFSQNNDSNISRNIVSFDLANETWNKVEQPDYGEGKFYFKLGILGSGLVVLCNYERHHSDVWMMTDYGAKASWKKMFTIRCPPDPRNFTFITPSSLSFSPFFCQTCKGEVLLLFHSVFMIYNPKDKSIRQVEVPELMGWFEAEIFVESLVNPLLIGDQRRDDNEG